MCAQQYDEYMRPSRPHSITTPLRSRLRREKKCSSAAVNDALRFDQNYAWSSLNGNECVRKRERTVTTTHSWLLHVCVCVAVRAWVETFGMRCLSSVGNFNYEHSFMGRKLSTSSSGVV